MQSYKDALGKKFDDSTLPELKEYYQHQFGEAAPKTMNGATMKAKLLRDAGIDNQFSSPQPKLAQPREPIFPAYNLSPNGIWGGRRHRIRVMRPHDATKNENVWEGSINGGPSYFIKYDEVQSVPEPVYMRIAGSERPVPVPKRIPREDGGFDITTEIKLVPRFAVDYKGVDDATKDLCGSLTEWYQRKRPDWFRKRSDRDLQLISQRLEINWKDEEGRPQTRQQILDVLIEFFFGFAEATDEPAEAAA